jgi:hypothetical protein
MESVMKSGIERISRNEEDDFIPLKLMNLEDVEAQFSDDGFQRSKRVSGHKPKGDKK